MKKNLLKLFPIVSLATLLPIVAFAQPSPPPTGGLIDVVIKIGELLSYILPVLIALGVIYFIWGVVMYMIADGEEAKKKGRDSIIYGIIGLAAIVAVWGLVNILLSTFGLEAGSTNNPGTNNSTTNIQNLLPH